LQQTVRVFSSPVMKYMYKLNCSSISLVQFCCWQSCVHHVSMDVIPVFPNEALGCRYGNMKMRFLVVFTFARGQQLCSCFLKECSASGGGDAKRQG
jgi:hypothetical protein